MTGSAGGGHFVFRVRHENGLIVVTAVTGGVAAGSVTVCVHGDAVIAVGRLYVAPRYRRHGAGRALMVYVLRAWPHAEAWLLAEPYSRDGDPPGAGKAALERFYASLGFRPTTDAGGRSAMRAAGSGVPAGTARLPGS